MLVRFPDGQELALTKGMLMLMNRDIVHSLSIPSEEDTVFGIQIEEQYMQNNLLFWLEGGGIVIDFLMKAVLGEQNDFTYAIFRFDEDSRINFIFEEMFCEYLDPKSCGAALIQNYIRIFFIQLIRSSDQHMVNFRATKVTHLLHYIENNSQDCSLDKLADEFGLSPKYIGSLLKEKTGKTFMELLTEARMKMVCFYLANTDRTIRDISDACGFSNHTYFYQKFVSMYGMTPREYREKRYKPSEMSHN